ncbi:hydroxyectoine utilization dehydratase EutB [Pelagibius marinus]|uniref:hydroxyectoine utilization dehydratase EutB n=1 Tax=Pelagibius marinus TaxID=2762760 RepID=UPI001872318B|nr:hydroxyectoine utilization dehydratase EutB [Pelagibius marinus]
MAGPEQGTRHPQLTDTLVARRRLAGRLRRTPLIASPSLTARHGAAVHLKCEHQQITGAFKLRGATNAVLALPPDQRGKGVTAASTGNHGRALAHAARAAGIPCIVCMSALVPANKVEAIEALGAEARIVGLSQDDAQVEVDRLVAEEGMIALPPFDHADIIAGQGTLGLEMLEELPEAETLLVPLSGGGLIAGVAMAAKTVKPSIRVVGISMQRGAAMHDSLKAGHPVPVEELPTLADSLGGGIGLDNRHSFAMVRDLVDEVLLVSEEEIAGAIRHAYAEERQVIEGAAAVGIAALLTAPHPDWGVTIALLSGGNIDMTLHQRIVAGENPDLLAERQAQLTEAARHA